MSDLTKRLRGRIVTTIFSVGDSDREWKTEKLKTPDALLVEAADHIDAQDAKIEQLEAALRESVKAMNGMSKMYATVWDRTDECLVVFKENVPRFDNAFCELGYALDKARALLGEA